MTGIYAGSFSPPTCGHLDVIRRAAQILDEVVVAILVNPEKKYIFSAEKRAQWLMQAAEGIDNIRVVWDNGLLVDVAQRCGAGVIVRGVRGTADLEYEMSLADVNRHLSGIDTIFLPAKPELGYISSTIVMDVARHGGSIRGMVPDAIADDIVNSIKESC